RFLFGRNLWCAPRQESLVSLLDPQDPLSFFLSPWGVAKRPVFGLELIEDALLLEEFHKIAFTQGCGVRRIPLDDHVADVVHLLLQTVRRSKGIRWLDRESKLLFFAHGNLKKAKQVIIRLHRPQ